MLAFSEDCHRLGYGGGFYDRTIAEMRAKRIVLTVGVAFEAQKFKSPDGEQSWDRGSLATEGTDEPLDFIVTE